MLPFSLLCPVRAESGDHRPDPGRFRHLDCTCSQCKEHACWIHVAVAQNDNHVDHCMLRVIIFVEISRQHGTCSWFIWNRVGKINNWMPYNGFKIYLMSRWTSKLSNYNDKCIYSKSTAAKTSEIYFPRNWTAGKSKAVCFEKGFRADPWTGRTRLRSFWRLMNMGLTPSMSCIAPKWSKMWWCARRTHRSESLKLGHAQLWSIMEVHKLVTAAIHRTAGHSRWFSEFAPTWCPGPRKIMENLHFRSINQQQLETGTEPRNKVTQCEQSDKHSLAGS